MHYLLKLFIITILLQSSACSMLGGGEKKPQLQASEQQDKKKKKPKKCKITNCHVRMVHLHEGSEFKGRAKWWLRPFFFFNKNPKYGQGLKREKRDPHQWRQ